MSWRLAKSLETLRAQINAAAPGRSKGSDGTIGDKAHSSRASDHNPNPAGVVTALDITDDPRHGASANAIAEALRASGDARLKYIIWNRRIWNPARAKSWRPYSGSNPHTQHVHISVKPDKALYDDVRAWPLRASVLAPVISAPLVPDTPVLVLGSAGPDVVRAKAILVKMLAAESGFGPLLEGLVKGLQKREGLTVDGKIGGYTWKEME